MFERRTSGATRIRNLLLTASIGLNLFFLGWVAARILPVETTQYPPPIEVLVADLASTMTPEGRARLETAFQANSPRIGAMQSGIDAAREAVRVALAQEPLDPEALAQALAALRARNDRVLTMVHQALVGIATDLSAEDRKRLANWQPHSVFQASAGDPPWAGGFGSRSSRP